MSGGLVVSWPWVWTVLGVFLTGYLAMWLLAFWYGRRERGIGWDGGYEAGVEAAGGGLVHDELPAWLNEAPALAGTVTTMGLPDDTFPGWPSTGRHAAADIAGERAASTGDLSFLSARLNADLFLAELEDWDTRTMAKLEGMLS